MKKNLRNILTLALGLMTTSVFAQDWNVDSRTRIDMGGDNGKMSTDQRATVGATWGGSDWGIHVSTDVNYTLGVDANGDDNAAHLGVYEAYASVNLMGYANMTIGRQALDYGSGYILSSNQWGDRDTWDGMTFVFDVDVADITVGYASQNDGDETNDDPLTLLVDESGDDVSNGANTMWANLSKADGDWNVNVLVARANTTELGEDAGSINAMGIDAGYAMMDGKLNLGVSYNTATVSFDGDGALVPDTEYDYGITTLSASYNVNENLTATVSQTTYDEASDDAKILTAMGIEDGTHGWADGLGADMNVSGMDNWNANGNMGHLDADQRNRSVGVSYSMDKFTLGATMHAITTNADDDVTTPEDESDYERNVTEFSIGYAMSDNANLSLKYASDEVGEADAEKYMWLTLNVTP